MNRVRLLAILGACAISLGAIDQSALADNAASTPAKGDASDGPTAQDLKNSKTRGIFFKAPGGDMPFQIEKGGQQTAPAANSKTAKKGVGVKASESGTKTKAVSSAKSGSEAGTKAATSKNAPAANTNVKSTGKPEAKAPAARTDLKTSSAAPAAAPFKVKVRAKSTKVEGAPTKTAVQSAPKKATNKVASAKVVPATEVVPATASSGAVSDQGGAVLKAWLNKTGKSPKYKDGDKMEISVNTSKDCNLVIYDFDGKGTLTQIFPNEYQKEAMVKAGDTINIGGEASNFDFNVSLADGSTKQEERLFIFAYPVKDEAPVSVAMAKIPSSPFRSAPMSIEQYRALVNQSKVYYARSVQVTAKKGMAVGAGSNIQTVANELNDGNSAPNKMELVFHVEK